MRAFRAHPAVALGGIVLTFNATAFAFVFFQVSSDRILEALLRLAQT
jgi:hypothetical protein